MTIFSIIIILLTPFVISASGIQVSPPKLELSGEINLTLVSQITAANPTADVQVFEVYPDDLSEIIEMSPKSFALEAGERKSVKIIIRAQTEGAFQTTLSVVSRPLAESRFSAAAGVKVPLTITITAATAKNHNFFTKPVLTIPIAMAIVFVILAIGIWHFLKKSKSQGGIINVQTAHSPPITPAAPAFPPAESQGPPAPNHRDLA